jgi:23S rRNA (cytosine1962-C5)-methyltransferase
MPWIYASDIIDSSELLHLPAGSLVAVENHKGQSLATGYYNARSQIACRILSLSRERIDVNFFKARIEKALAIRQRLVGVPYYRLVHSEADGLPGLLVDRFGEHLVVQTGTAGMDKLQTLWLPALEQVLAPKTIILRNDIPARQLEGLTREVKLVKGEAPDFIEVQENGCVYYADLIRGQKTGWFYDQRDNRKMIAAMAAGKTVLDVYSHSGGFGVLAAMRGASRVSMVDSSKLALELAVKAARHNGVEKCCAVLAGDAFETMERLRQQGDKFDIVLADPPAFVKSRKDIASGLKGYEKVARQAAALVKPGGLLFVASCSHHASRSAFNKAVLNGTGKAGLRAEIIKQTGAAADHPRHPALPQNEYLKGILLTIRE